MTDIDEQLARHQLSERDNEQIFRKMIAPRLLDTLQRPDHPHLQFVLGQAGAGKTSAHRQALERLGSAGAVVAEYDSFLPDHPDYAGLLLQDDRTAGFLVGRDAQAWLMKSIDLAADQRMNLIREGGNGPGNEAMRFAGTGYTVGADVMAVPAAVSRLSVLSRYQRMREQVGFGRTVRTQVHDRTFETLPKMLNANDNRLFFSEVRLHRRDGSLAYHNKLDESGSWQAPPAAAAALLAEQNRPLGSAEAAWFVQRFEELSRTLPPDLREQLPEIAALARPLGVEVPGLDAGGSGPAVTAADRERVAMFTQDVPLRLDPSGAAQAGTPNRGVAGRAAERGLD